MNRAQLNHTATASSADVRLAAPDRGATAKRPGLRHARGARGASLVAAATWIGPSYLIFLLIMAFPAVWNVVTSLFTTSYAHSTFVGLSNYKEVLTSGQFYSSLWLTVYWTASVFVGQFLVGLLLALFFNRRLSVAKYMKPLLIIPWAIPGIVAATAWSFLYSQTGLIDQVLGVFLKSPPAWLASPSLAMPAVIVAGIWKGAPFYFLMILAGLQSIPKELVEAAQIDGAGRIRVLVSVELPYIANILAVTSVLGVIWTVNYFDGIYLMTQGGPINATQTLPIWIYNTAFSSFNLSEASAMSVILLIIVLVFTVPALRRREEA